MSNMLIVVLILCVSNCVYVQGFGLLQNVQYSDKCLNVKDGSLLNNADLEISPCDSSKINQQLNVEDWNNYGSSAGQMKFQYSQKCLTVFAKGTSNGDLINQHDCWNGATNQLWKIVGSYNGNFQIQNVGSSKCLTAEGGGTYTDQWDCLGESAAPHQTWRIVKSGSSSSRGSDSSGGRLGVFAFENFQFSGKCLNAADGISGNSSSLNIQDCDTTSSTQLFAGTKLVSIYGSIVIYNTNLCLNVYRDSQSNGGQIGTHSCSNNNAKNEIWGLRIDSNNPSAFQIVSGSSGKCVTADSGGTWIDQWDCFGIGSAPHQWWKFRQLSTPPTSYPTTGYLLESAVYPNKCLRIQSRSTGNNANMHLMSCNPADTAQVMNMKILDWDVRLKSSSTVAITIQRSSKCLTVNGASGDNGAYINQYDCLNPLPGNQQWKMLTTNNDGYEGLFEFQNAGSGKCLTAAARGTYLHQWDCYSYGKAPHQFWRIRRVEK